jgi:hypothetical protein
MLFIAATRGLVNRLPGGHGINIEKINKIHWFIFG